MISQREKRKPPTTLAKDLLEWFDQHGRTLPWRVKGRPHPDAYAVWLSEIMLQQTTVPTVKPYFENFLKKWPTVQKLAHASLDEVLHAWQGLGYYARARNLHQCAQVVTQDYQGKFPTTAENLLKLPGIGPYTAGAIASLAFGEPATIMDGNVIRVIARFFGISTPLPAAKEEIYKKAKSLTPLERTYDYSSAIMDLGATICTPTSPKCLLCPWHHSCKAHATGSPENFPTAAPKIGQPLKKGVLYWVTNNRQEVLIRKRPTKGLLGGMMEFPWFLSTDKEPLVPKAQATQQKIEHTFTHFRLHLDILALQTSKNVFPDAFWCPISELHQQAFPTLMNKVIRKMSSQ